VPLFIHVLVVCDIIFEAFSGLYVCPSARTGVWLEFYVFQTARQYMLTFCRLHKVQMHV
jgi:hypothetical protein